MKAAILSLVAAAALAATAGSADARPPRYHNGGNYSRSVVRYPSVNTSPYYGYRGYGYPGGYYSNYGSGFGLNVGGFGLGIGSGLYPYGYNSGYYNNYYSRPYYGRGWRW